MHRLGALANDALDVLTDGQAVIDSNAKYEYRDVLQRNCLDCVNSVMLKDCLVYVCIAFGITTFTY